MDDAVDEDAGAVTVTLMADTADPATYALDRPSEITATVIVTDDDTRGVTLSTASLTVAEGGTDTYTVVLSSAPTGPVTVTPSSDNTDVTLSPMTLTLTATNWNAAQTVMVTAAQDGDLSDDHASITHAVAGADYASETAAAVTVTVTDDRMGDTTAPTVTIGDVPATSTATFTATFAFSEPVTGFVVGDIALANATASEFIGGGWRHVVYGTDHANGEWHGHRGCAGGNGHRYRGQRQYGRHAGFVHLHRARERGAVVHLGGGVRRGGEPDRGGDDRGI